MFCSEEKLIDGEGGVLDWDRFDLSRAIFQRDFRDRGQDPDLGWDLA